MGCKNRYNQLKTRKDYQLLKFQLPLMKEVQYLYQGNFILFFTHILRLSIFLIKDTFTLIFN